MSLIRVNTKAFGERLLSLGSEESGPKDGMCI